ncbi:MAG: TetR/AcrR family transcriptional regulator [Hyphomicrobiales bacterium]|nr:TetR/AcrR family transcriptional regulator [Hyphomicrobiales bacterium]
MTVHTKIGVDQMERAAMKGGETSKAGYHHGDLREALLVAAEEELAEKGVEGFTLRGCAKRAGVSHAAPAHHFKDADGLLTALAAVGFTRFTTAMTARQSAAPVNSRERLVALGLGYIDFAISEPALFRLMFASGRPDFNDPELQQVAMNSLGQLIQGVSAVRGSAAQGDKAAMLDVAAAWSMVHGIADLALSGRMKFMDEPGLAGDPDATYRNLIERILPRME